MKNNWRNRIRKQVAVLCLLPATVSAELSTPHVRSGDADLQSVWELLDDARRYRQDWFVNENTGKLSKNHTQLMQSYVEDEAYCGSITAQSCFIKAADQFNLIINTGDKENLREEARWGLQESLNEYMAGQSLVGNDLLINGLRARFPIEVSGEKKTYNDPLILLTDSQKVFQDGIDHVVEHLRLNKEVIRKSEVHPDKTPKFLVSNSIPFESEKGASVTENEAYRFTNLVQRAAVAANSKGKRMFFSGNVKDIDRFPYGSFPGKEDLDVNGDREINSGGRAEAKKQFKESAFATYMHTILLSAVQSESEFFDNNGYTLKRQITDAERVFNDINEGFNPLKLSGDFVPFQPVENFISLARERIKDASILENDAKITARNYDIDQTQLAQTLSSLKTGYLDRIEQLTGLDTTNFTLPQDHKKLVAAANITSRQGRGTLGTQYINIQAMEASIDTALLRVLSIYQKIENEQSRQNRVATLVMETGIAQGALTVTAGVWDTLNSMTPEKIATGNGGQFGVFAAVTRGLKDVLAATERSQIEGINSASRVKDMLIEMVVVARSVIEAQISLRRELAQYNELLADLDRTIDSYGQSRDDLASSYLLNPAYRLDKDQLFEAAEESFETAMVETYYAAKALEYNWSEKFNNPVLRLDATGLPESLSAAFDPYIRAESVFSARFADGKSPSLGGYLDALQAWDVKMRQFRSPARQSGTVNLSMQKDILKFKTEDPEFDNLLFKEFISEHRVVGTNANNDDLQFEFSIQITDEKLFPNFPNIKIDNISVNLVSGDKSIRGGSTAAPALVDLVQLDKSMVRSFFATDIDDDVLLYDLEEGRTIEGSPFIATVEASVDYYSYPLAAVNVQLADHSPAVSRWVLRIKMNRKPNENLDLASLQDIELKIAYNYGKPRNIQF